MGRAGAVSGGRAAGAAAGPTTLICSGTTGAAARTAPALKPWSVMRMVTRATGCDWEKAAAGTAMIAPGTCRLV